MVFRSFRPVAGFFGAGGFWDQVLRMQVYAHQQAVFKNTVKPDWNFDLLGNEENQSTGISP